MGLQGMSEICTKLRAQIDGKLHVDSSKKDNADANNNMCNSSDDADVFSWRF